MQTLPSDQSFNPPNGLTDPYGAFGDDLNTKPLSPLSPLERLAQRHLPESNQNPGSQMKVSKVPIAITIPPQNLILKRVDPLNYQSQNTPPAFSTVEIGPVGAINPVQPKSYLQVPNRTQIPIAQSDNAKPVPNAPQINAPQITKEATNNIKPIVRTENILPTNKIKPTNLLKIDPKNPAAVYELQGSLENQRNQRKNN